jgi:hypothetical protein
MKQAGSFAEVLKEYVGRSAYRPGQLARLTGVPQRTIVNWLEGRVRQPRAWQDVIKLAQALRLSLPETDVLLTAVEYPSIKQLRLHTKDEAEQALFTFWAEVSPAQEKPAPFQIIPDLPTFVGREKLLARLRELLLADYHEGAYLLTGTVGMGKTVLAVRLAYQLRSHFGDGVLWARLDTMPMMAILQLWGEAYGRDVSMYEDIDSRSTAVRELLAHKQVLLVLDNVQDEKQIEPLLPVNGTCTALITSRRRNLTALPESHRFHVEAFNEAETMALLTRVLGEEQVANEQKVLQEMATLVGHHPLAIDLAACRLAYEANWQTAAFLQHLYDEKQRLQLLAHGERGLATALETSYNLLPPPLQQFYASLGKWDGLDFSGEEAAVIAGVTPPQADVYLQELFCLSLVRRGQISRYRLIPVVRDFAREKQGCWHKQCQ